jgi:hypothetical protein
MRDLTNSVTQDPTGSLLCSCGAKCSSPKDHKRFHARHPKLCAERRDFARQLAQGTRSVESGTSEDPSDLAKVTRHQIEAVNAVGRGLTFWEEDFMESVTEQFEERAWLTDRQREILERIYDQRT